MFLRKIQLNSIYILLSITILFYCLDYFYRISPSLVLTDLLNQYHMSPLGIAAMASAFYLGYVIFQIPAGLFFDHYNFNKVMIISVIICTVAYWIFLFLHNYQLGILARFLIGAGSAFSFIGVLHLARSYIPLKNFSFIAGITIALGTVSAAFAQFICAFFLRWLNWHMVFSFLACWGIVVAILLSLPSLNLRHQILITPSQPVIRLQAKPVAILKLFLLPTFTLNGIIGGLMYLPTSIFAGLWGITFLKLGYHFTDEQSSFAILLVFVGWAIGSPIVGLLGDRMRSYANIMGSMALLTGILTLIILLFPNSLHIGIYFLLFLFGLFSSFQVLVWRHFNAICPLELSATGIAITNMIIMFSTSIFHTIAGRLIGTEQGAVSFLQIQHGLYSIPLVFFITFVLSFFLKQPHRD